jgi:serine/threonine protein kinase
MPGNPGYNPEELFKRAVRELAAAIPGLEQELHNNHGVVSPEMSARLAQFAAKSPVQKVRDRVQYILSYQESLQKKDETGKFERVFPLPHQPVVPEGLSKTPTPPSGEVFQLADLPGALQQRLQDMIQADPQKFVQTYLVPAFAPKFDQLKFIAKGGMGIIVKARQVSLHRDVAIKLNTQMIDAAMVQSFMNEGKNAAQAESANVVEVYDSDFAKILLGKMQVLVPYHLLKFVEGAKDGTFLLKAMEQAEKPFPEESALILAKQFAKGLAAAHRKGIIHRDVKPDNVLIPPDEQKLIKEWVSDGDAKNLTKGLQEITGLKVADFGLAGVRLQTIEQEIKTSSENQQVVTDQHTLTGDNSIIGTLYYIPPEGYADAQSAGKPWDVYSLGLVVYSLLTGNDDPLKYSKGIKRGKESPMSYAIKIGGDQRKTPAISEDDPFIQKFIEQDPRNKRIVKMLQKLTAFDPAERPTLEEFLQWIEEELDKRSEKTLRAKKAEKEAKVASQGKRTATWAAGGVAAALLSLIASIPMINKSQRQDEFLRTQAQSMQDTEELLTSGKWNEAITLLGTQVKVVEENTDLDAQERSAQLELLQKKLQHARSQVEKQTRAEELISQGDRFFQIDGAIFAEGKRILAEETGRENPAPKAVRDRLLEEAKHLYAEALRVGEGTQAAEIVRQKICRWNYVSGVRAYNRGELTQAQSSFQNVMTLNFDGLSTEERDGLMHRKTSLSTALERQSIIQSKAREIFSQMERTSFSKMVESHAQRVRSESSTEDFAVLLKVQNHFDDWIATLTGDESNRDASQRIARDQIIQERLARMDVLRSVIFETYPQMKYFPPETVQHLQTFFYGNHLIKEGQINIALENRNYDQAIHNYMKLFEYADQLKTLIDKEGVAFDPLEGMEGFLSTLMKNIMTSARDRLPPNKKAQLNGLLREQFPDAASFIRTQTAAYLG